MIFWASEVRLSPPASFSQKFYSRPNLRNPRFEALYRYPLSNNISTTSGAIWLAAPGHNSSNNDIVIETLRTTFPF
ncbi:carbohydrate porin [Microcoleus sp. FACHB-672]|uniref:carbohydrate porin n=1 Tax=Microcoleus sp. FACHB-672 TaxID=2692825 RepID=UPI0016859838|nr:carbohydrate porin [Microcoleus sp. FACHB-672]MBD2041405.1 carbohydrate porin [Microcoleus sp. FACHB-672]